MAQESFVDENGMIEEYSRTASGSWGYTIYRTVYAPQSDEQFSTALRKLQRYMHEDIYRSSNPTDQRRTVADSIMARYHVTVLEDAGSFDQANLDNLRHHFLQTLSAQGRAPGDWGPDNRSFVVIDEEGLNNILNAPIDSYEAVRYGAEWTKHCIKVVDATLSGTYQPPAPGSSRGRGMGRGRPGRASN